VRGYLRVLPKYGVHATRGIIFGSFARGESTEWSDIDLIVVAREFDVPYGPSLLENLWCATGETDNRIEPIPCGEREWETGDNRPIIEIARREGVVVGKVLEMDGAPGRQEGKVQ